MYAIILTGGKQVKAEVGKTIYVEKLDGKEGTKVSFDKVLYVDNNGTTKVGAPYLKGAKVSGTICKQGKEKKIRVLKKQEKSNVRVHRGHRQPFSAVKVEEIVSE